MHEGKTLLGRDRKQLSRAFIQGFISGERKRSSRCAVRCWRSLDSTLRCCEAMQRTSNGSAGIAA
jgi:hypothetical protein